MERKKRVYPAFKKYEKRKQGGDIASCSVATLHFFIAQNEKQQSNFIVTDHSSRFQSSSFFPFDEGGYNNAIDLYEWLIAEFLDKVENEFYE